jgi:hypothetical protein
VLEDYFANIKLRTKRERELKHFQMLSKDYSHPDIADCLLYVQKYGLPGSGVRCHAPMGFLASSMDVVLLCVLEERQKEQQRRESERLADLRKTREAEEKAAFEAKFNHIKHLFIEAFPSKEEREEQYDTFAELNPVHEKGSYALKSATVLHWFSQQQDQ